MLQGGGGPPEDARRAAQEQHARELRAQMANDKSRAQKRHKYSVGSPMTPRWRGAGQREHDETETTHAASCE